MTLLNIYKTEPKHLLNTTYSDFDDPQWQDLAVHLGSYQRDAYDAEVMRHLLPIIGNRVLWLNTTSAQQFLYTAIFHNDAVMVRFILEHFENVRNGPGVIEQWISYIQTALEMLHDIAIKDRNYNVLNVLFEYFKDDGCGVLFCVQNTDWDLFERVLSHTASPATNTVTAYCWAQISDLKEFQHILEPISCKIEALYECEWATDWFDRKQKDVVARMAQDLYENIVEGYYDSQTPVQLFKECLNTPCNWTTINFASFSPLCLQKIVLLLSERNKENARTLISHIDAFDNEMSALIAGLFKDTPSLIVPRLSDISRQEELCTCARTSDKEFAQHLVAAGANLYHALDELSAKKGWHNSNHSFIKDIVQRQNDAASVVQHWINEQQAQTIANELNGWTGKSSNRKI